MRVRVSVNVCVCMCEREREREGKMYVQLCMVVSYCMSTCPSPLPLLVSPQALKPWWRNTKAINQSY